MQNYIYIYIYSKNLATVVEDDQKLHFQYLLIFTNPSARAGYDTRLIFKLSLTGLNSEFSFSQTSCLTKAEEPSLSYYLPIAGGRIIGFIPFPRVLVRCEMQSVSSRIWTRITVSISHDDNHHTTCTSNTYYTEVLWRALLLSLDWSNLPLIRTLYCWVLSMEVSSTILKIFGMTWPGVETRFPRPLANTLPTRAMSWYV